MILVLRFRLVFSQGVNKLITQQTSHANDVVNAKSHACRFMSERRQDDSCLLRFTLVCSQGVNKLTMQQTSQANDFVNAKSHARDLCS